MKDIKVVSKLRSILVIIPLIAITICCESNEDEPKEPDTKGIIQFSSIRVHPDGIVLIEFYMDCAKLDTSQYEIEWINPPDAIECMQYEIQIVNDYQLKYRLIDKESLKSYDETYNILIDTMLGKYDYREIYTGNYNLNIYTYGFRVSGEGPFICTEYHDTIERIGVVDYFYGYTAGSDSNYEDIDIKLGIRYSDYNLNWDDSRCAWTRYYVHGFLHPTVDLSGNITYPEFESCSGRLTGYIRNDTILINYGWWGKWDGFIREISGTRIIE